jgi:cell division protein FtsL
MKRPKLIISIAFLVIVILSIVRVSIENSISTTGIELVELNQEAEKYRKENFELEEKYLTESSLTQVASKAAVLGFIPSEHTINLSTSLPLALNNSRN